jgi:hypothetical protein
MTRIFPLLLVVGLLCSACENRPGGPSDISLTGTWTGTASGSLTSDGSVQVNLTHTGSTISGTWAPIVQGGSGGTVSGTINGSTVLLTLTPNNSAFCPVAVTATVTASQISGTYATINCSVSLTGTFDVTRQ